MRPLGAAALLVLFAGLFLVCPLHGAGEQGSTPFHAPAEAGVCAVLHNLTAEPILAVHPIPLVALGAIAPRADVLLTWILAHSIQHPPG